MIKYIVESICSRLVEVQARGLTALQEWRQKKKNFPSSVSCKAAKSKKSSCINAILMKHDEGAYLLYSWLTSVHCLVDKLELCSTPTFRMRELTKIHIDI